MTLAPRLALASSLLLAACTEVVVVDDATGAGGAASTTVVTTTSTSGSTTTSGTGGAGGAACGPDLSSDPHSCGACGHDCLGGACLAGACQPVELAHQDGQPWEIALDGGHVYWSNTYGQISSVPKPGGTISVLTEDLTNPGQLTVFGVRAYSASYYGTVLSVPIGGGKLLPITAPVAGGLAVATGPDGIYWVTGQPAPAVKNVVHTDFGGKVTTVLASAQREPTALAVDATHAYWSDYVDDDSGAGGVRRVPLAGGAPETLAAHRSLVSLTLDETHVYYLFGGTSEASWKDGALYAIPKQGGAPLLVADGLAGTGRVAVDATHAYWTEAYSFTVRRAPKHGGPAETLVKVDGNPQGIAVDDAAVYWVDPGAQAVMKLAK
jgi:hypothetical protein